MSDLAKIRTDEVKFACNILPHNALRIPATLDDGSTLQSLSAKKAASQNGYAFWGIAAGGLVTILWSPSEGCPKKRP
jgi:hypothetical protein